MKIIHYDPLPPFTKEEKAWLRARGQGHLESLDDLIEDLHALHANRGSDEPRPDELNFAARFWDDPYVKQITREGWRTLPANNPSLWHFGAREEITVPGRRPTKKGSLLFFRDVFAPALAHGLMSDAILYRLNHNLYNRMNRLAGKRGINLAAILPPHHTVKSSFVLGRCSGAMNADADEAGPAVDEARKPAGWQYYVLRPPRLTGGEFRRETASEFVINRPRQYAGRSVYEIKCGEEGLVSALYGELQELPENKKAAFIVQLKIRAFGEDIMRRPGIREVVAGEASLQALGLL